MPPWNGPLPALQAVSLSFSRLCAPRAKPPVSRDCAAAAPVIWNRFARLQPIGPLERLESTQAYQPMPPQPPLPRIAWIAVMAVAARPQATPAME